MYWRTTAMLSLAMIAAPACSDEPAGPTIERELVAGVYTMAALSFDPQGSLPDKDILVRLGAADRPQQFTVSATGNTFQLVFLDPGGTFTVAEGSYGLLEDGIRITFSNESQARRVLLPRRLNLTRGETNGALSFTGNQTVPLGRLRELVPEFENEPLADPVPGQLSVVFTRSSVE